MDIVLTHTSALSYIRHPDFLHYAAGAQGCSLLLPDELNKPSAAAETLRKSGVLAANGNIEFLVRHNSMRKQRSFYTVHQCSFALPSGALFELTPEIRVVSPLLLPVLLTRRYRLLELALLLSEFMGLYVLDPSTATGLSPRSHPLFLRHRMLSFLDELGPVSGSDKVRQAVKLAPEYAASPMEAKLAMRMNLGYAAGGYKLGKFLLNDPLEVRKLSARIPQLQVRKADILFITDKKEGASMPFWGVALDYKGLWHADARQSAKDDQRLNELLAAGIKDYSIWKQDYDNLDYMDTLVQCIKRDLGITRHRSTKEQARKERAARYRLWQELEHARMIY